MRWKSSSTFSCSTSDGAIIRPEKRPAMPSVSRKFYDWFKAVDVKRRTGAHGCWLGRDVLFQCSWLCVSEGVKHVLLVHGALGSRISSFCFTQSFDLGSLQAVLPNLNLPSLLFACRLLAMSRQHDSCILALRAMPRRLGTPCMPSQRE